MLTLDCTRRSRFAFPILALLICASVSVSIVADQATPAEGTQDKETQHFSTTKGGLSLDIPAGWHANEFPGPSVYRCTISPNAVKEEQDPIALGLLVERASDYTSAFGWKKSDPETNAVSYLIHLGTKELVSKGKSCVVSFAPPSATPEQISEAIANSRGKTPGGGKGLPAVVLIPYEPSKAVAGMESFQYDVITDYQGENCVYRHVLVGITKKQWLALNFLATDCKRMSEVRPLFVNAVASLEVNKKWPK